MKLIRHQSTYDVNDVPVYDKVRFTSGSTNFLDSPNAMEFPRKSGGFLQSLGHAIVARVAFHEDNEATGRDLDDSTEYQKTSTVNIKYHDGKGWHSAFMELPDEEASFELVKAGYKEHYKSRELAIPRSDLLVAKLIRWAEEAGRVRPVFKVRYLHLSTKQNRGRSEYGSDPDAIAAIGHPEIAELNASYLQKRQREHGLFRDLTEKEVENKMKGEEDQVLIRPVGLDGYDYEYDDIGSIDACNKFINEGWARGVVNGAHKISLETKVAEVFRA